MSVMEEFKKTLEDMYIFSNKMYEVLNKNGKDRHLADLVTNAENRNEIFLSQQLMKARNSMDQTYLLIEYLHKPVLLDGRLEKTEEGTYSLCGSELKKRVGIEYIHNDQWEIGLFEPCELANGFRIVDEKFVPVNVELEHLRVRTREQI